MSYIYHWPWRIWFGLTFSWNLNKKGIWFCDWMNVKILFYNPISYCFILLFTSEQSMSVALGRIKTHWKPPFVAVTRPSFLAITSFCGILSPFLAICQNIGQVDARTVRFQCFLFLSKGTVMAISLFEKQMKRVVGRWYKINLKFTEAQNYRPKFSEISRTF